MTAIIINNLRGRWNLKQPIAHRTLKRIYLSVCGITDKWWHQRKYKSGEIKKINPFMGTNAWIFCLFVLFLFVLFLFDILGSSEQVFKQSHISQMASALTLSVSHTYLSFFFFFFWWLYILLIERNKLIHPFNKRYYEGYSKECIIAESHCHWTYDYCIILVTARCFLRILTMAWREYEWNALNLGGVVRMGVSARDRHKSCFNRKQTF